MALSFAAVGCKKKPVRTTPIPGQGGGITTPGPGVEAAPGGVGAGAGTGVTGAPIKDAEGNIPLPTTDITGRPQDRERLKAFTVYFDFDRSNVRPDQASKLESVAAQFKNAAPGEDLLIEGHCDERGTEEYNRALGERRALALREFLTTLGVNPAKMHTLSFGKSKPVDPGHNEAAWSKNRRGEFIVVLPK